MYNPYQYQMPQQGQQNFMQPWTQNQFQQQWQQPAQQMQPAMPAQPPQPEPQQPPMMPPPSDIAQAIHRLCDILEAWRGGQNNGSV